jgi:hypothetical protein
MRQALLRIWNIALCQRLPLVPWQIVVWVLGATSILALVPLFWLLGASFPQADDTCLARHLHLTNLWGVGEFIYFNWSGRVLEHVLMALPGWAAVSGIMPFAQALQVGNFLLLIVLMMTLVGACYQLLGQWRYGSAAAVLLLSWWAWHLPSPVDAFYWYSATAAYTMIIPLTLIFMGALLALTVGGRGTQLAAMLVGMLVGLALTSMHELGAILALEFIILLLAYFWWWRFPKLPIVLAGLIGLAVLIGSLIIFLAPGNAVRIAASAPGQGFLVALAGGLPLGVGWVLAQLNLVLLIWLAVWAVLVQQVSSIKRFQQWPLAGWLGLGLVGMVLISPTLGLLANGESLPPRAENILHFWLVWGCMLVVGWAVGRYGLPKPMLRYKNYAYLALAVVLVASPTWVRAVHDTRLVAGLRTAYAQREALLQQAARTQQPVVVPPFLNIPKTAYRETLQPNPQAWQNICAAQWYRVPQLTLQP